MLTRMGPKPSRRRLLVTAFGAFPGARSNPTLAIARDLQRRHAGRFALLGIDLAVEVLPVRFLEVEPALDAALARHRPDAVLHLGLAGRRKSLSVETRALNRLGALRPDAGRGYPEGPSILPGAPAILASRWPAERIRAAMDRHALTRLSIDAGDYVCNQTLFLSLSKLAGPVGFIHVPRPRGRGRAREGAAHPSLARMVEAVAAAALVLARPPDRLDPASPIDTWSGTIEPTG